MQFKSYSHFFSKKFQHICLSLDVNFNESLTNDVISFEQLDPGQTARIHTLINHLQFKSYSHFFSKKFQHICISLDVNFNESLTNDVISFEQLDPGQTARIHTLIRTFAARIWHKGLSPTLRIILTDQSIPGFF